MFQNDKVKNHFLTSPTIKSNARIIADWNLNNFENIQKIGNYRYRPASGIQSKYGSLPSSFDQNDEGNFYTDATYSDILLDGGIDDSGTPMLLKQSKEKERLLYSLEDCFGRFRPRSGINKVRYGITNYLHHSNPEMSKRPRYYMASKEDAFKYWTSYRNENGIEYGIANNTVTAGQHIINDAAPFVVYYSPIAANRIVIKMQTNIGSVNLAPFSSLNGDISDPFYGQSNATTPSEWTVDVLINNQWQTIKSFKPGEKRLDGSPIIKEDGYVELAYGLVVPNEFSKTFTDLGVISSEEALPSIANVGDAYLIKTNETDLGMYKIWSSGGWIDFTPIYGWYLANEEFESSSSFVTSLSNPPSYAGASIDNNSFREFQYISGIRIAASKMNKFNSTFDVIEISPRLVADISDLVMSYSVSKAASDLGNAGLPVGQLLASTGSLTIFDPELSFLETNPLSIVPFESFKNMQIKLYDVVDLDNVSYYIPVKTMYVDTFPTFNPATRQVELSLRDLYFYFESLSAPSLLLTNISISYAVATLLDYIGFSNYVFKRLPTETEDIIPFFFTDSDKTIAEVLQDLAIATQTTMFFDEYNNFVMMSRGYMLPSETDRPADFTILGSNDFEQDGIIKNKNTATSLANIIDISAQPDTIFNDGKINFTSRYIRKSQASTKQTYMLDSQSRWVYKPVTLWEASGNQNSKSQNEQQATQNSYDLTAIPLKSSLSVTTPNVVNGQIVNNIIDFGEAVYWLGKYSGFFYANGEIIRFDAIEYSIPGIIDSVWINSVDEYQNYFSKIPFNGKMYPTGRVRIFAEPNYRIVNNEIVLANGPVVKHGRGQFGTPIVEHPAGINTTWTNGTKVRGLAMNSKFIFDVLSSDGQPKAVDDLVAEQEAYRQIILQKKNAIKILIEEINALQKKLLLDPSNTQISTAIDSLNDDITTAEESIADAMESLSDSLQASVKFMNINDANKQAKRTQTTGKIKNFLSYSYLSENQGLSPFATDAQMVQASALILEGTASTKPEFAPINHITYVYTNTQSVNNTVNNFYTHFGTRMRVLGKVMSNSDARQEAYGSMPYLTVDTDNPKDNPVISGGSGGIAGLLNPENGDGYYFEIAALDAENVDKYNAANIFFYKMVSSNSDDTAVDRYSMPQLLWRGLSDITVDSGDFVGQSRIFAQETQTVYDLAFEYVDNVDGTRTFFLYLNGVQIATVTDILPIVAGNAIALFTRGTSKCLFENIYGLSHNYADNPSLKLSPVINSAFGKDVITINESFSKYSISGLVQSTYLAGIGPSAPPKYNIYYDEFGTIMREAAYFNVKYDKAYPALYSKIAPTISKLKSYTTSSYFGGSYNAEFLVFNATDTVLLLDQTTGSPLQIQGIAFTQESSNELTVDEFFNDKSDLSNPTVENSLVVSSPTLFKQRYQDIKNLRVTYGRNEFTIDSPYIQSRDFANKLMSWLSDKVMKPRKSVGAKIFATPILQLGDIVEIIYNDSTDSVANTDIVIDQLGFTSLRFVVYQIDYSRDSSGPTMDIYLSEVN